MINLTSDALTSTGTLLAWNETVLSPLPSYLSSAKSFENKEE
jgi:hypothetical protein